MTCMVFNADDPTDSTEAIGALWDMGGEGGTHPVLTARIGPRRLRNILC